MTMMIKVSTCLTDQSVDAGIGGDVDEILVEFAPGDTERPLCGGVEECSERDTNRDKDEICQRQT